MAEITEYYPYDIKAMDSEETAELSKYCSGNSSVRIGPKGYCLREGITEIASKIYNMKLRPDDTWVLSYPKSGTTWTQELVWMVANDFDYTKAAEIPLIARFPFLEIEMILTAAREDFKDDRGMDFLMKSFEHVNAMPSPRFIKSHLPLSLLPPALLDSNKVVYVARDPRDVAVSYYHHFKLFSIRSFTGEFKDYWNLFIKDLINYCPSFDNVKEAWNKRNHPNMLFLFYEDLLKDLPAAIKKVAEFLGKPATEEQISRLCEHLSFENFKNNKSVNMDKMKMLIHDKNNITFIRKGKAGGWREWFDDEMTQQAERWIADNLRDTDLRFPTID